VETKLPSLATVCLHQQRKSQKGKPVRGLIEDEKVCQGLMGKNGGGLQRVQNHDMTRPSKWSCISAARIVRGGSGYIN
jgi:hypothetical protein